MFAVEIEKVISDFENTVYIELEKLLDENILNFLKDLFDRDDFKKADLLKGTSTELNLQNTVISMKLIMLFTRSEFLSFASKAIGKEVVNVETRVYYQDRHSKGLIWHNDKLNERRIGAIRIDLSEDEYQGGDFLIRTRGEKDLIGRVKSKGFGKTLIFRIEEDLEHMVTNVEGEGIRRSLVIFLLGPKSQ